MKIFTVLAAVLVAALYFALAPPVSESSVAPPAPIKAATTVHPRRPAETAATRLVPGDWLSFSVDHQVAVTLDGAAPTADDPPALRIRGRWRQTLVRQDAGGIAFEVRFTPRALAPTEMANVAQLAQPFTLELDGNGRIEAVAFEAGVSPEARQLLRTLAATAQLQRSPTDVDTWSVQEEDTSGWYRADYTQGAETITRTKITYDRLMTGDGPTDVRSLGAFDVDAQTTFALGADAWPWSIEGAERMTIGTGDNTPTIRSLVRYRWVRVGRGEGPLPRLADRRSEPMVTSLSDAGDPLELDRQLARGANFDDLSAALTTLEARTPGRDRRQTSAHAISQLSAILRLDPAAAARTLEVLRDPSAAPNTATVMTAALSGAGTPESRAALLELSRADGAAARAEALHGLAMMENADADTVARLIEMLDDPELAAPAALSLGANARSAAENGAATTDAIDRLLAAWDAASSSAERMVVVDALGNSGDPRALPILKSALMQQDGELRAAAISALRFMPGAEVDQLLATVLQAQDPVMQIAAVQAVAMRDLETWRPALAALLETELRADVADLVRSVIS